MTAPVRPVALPVKYANIPLSLTNLMRWVCWRYVLKRRKNGAPYWTKVPYQPGGREARTNDPSTWSSYEECQSAYALGDFDGLGLVLSDELTGVDLDDCIDPVTGEMSAEAKEALERIAGYAEISPSGTGIKIFTISNLDGSHTAPGYEIYRGARYFTITGASLDGHDDLPTVAQDVGWFVERHFGEHIAAPDVSTASEDQWLALYKNKLDGWDADRIREEIAPFVDVECHYEEWIKAGLAIHHQFDGSEDGFTVWDEMFQGSSKYGGPEYGAERWRSFKTQRLSGRGAVTLASLIKKVQPKKEQLEREQRDTAMADLQSSIAVCTDARDLQEKIAKRIAKGDFTDVEREQLASSIQEKAKSLGVKLPITKIRGWLRKRIQQGAGQLPDWAQPWVYVTDGDKFFNTDTKQEVTSIGFRRMYNRHMPVNMFGDREQADKKVTEDWGMTCVAHKAYMPTCQTTFELHGLCWVNLYRPDSTPPIPATFTAEDLAAIEVVKQHVALYLSDPREQELLLSFCAHNIQYPGKKIRWAPYVYGVEGDGKSFFGELIGAAMGSQNVRMLNASTLESNFTDWATGHGLIVLEEMKQHGHNRYDIMNKLKAFVTNSQVEIHPKGKPSYTAPNVANYLLLSNYLDGAPVTDTDRRYMFLASGLKASDVRQMTSDGYFKTLFAAVHEHPGAIRKWLLTYTLHPDFDADGRAPDTKIKQTVIEMSKPDVEVIAEELIEQGADGVSKVLISSAHFSRAIRLRTSDAPSTTRLNGLLTKLGFRFLKRQRWRDEVCRIWVACDKLVTEDQIVALLDKTSQDHSDFLDTASKQPAMLD